MLLVVQLAHEMMDVPPLGRLTPWTTVGTSALLVGPERITHFALASICLLASSCVVNKPVHSKTSSTPRSLHGSRAGSLHGGNGWAPRPRGALRPPLPRPFPNVRRRCRT